VKTPEFFAIALAAAVAARKLFFEGDLDSAGDVADDKVLKSVVVELGDGQKLPARYGPHPPRGALPTDFFWSSHWEIPADYPTGSLGYKVIVTMMDDTTQTWEPFKRAPSQLTVIAGEPEMKN